MSRITWGLVLLLLFLVPLPGLNLLNKISYALDHSIQIKGKVVDAESKASIGYAIVSLVLLPDTVPFKNTATDSKGEFSFSNLRAGDYSMTVHFMGFKDFTTMPITLSGKESVVRMEPIPIEIGNVEIGEISVSAKSGKPVYQIDKKIINVENQLSGTGGSAADLMYKFPSVSQAPDGNISIQGNSNLLVFINGKPQALKGNELLQSTPASEIKKIELITSPSAKYDASGSAGIINLITKKSVLEGFNGNVLVAADQLGGYSSDLLVNYKYHDISFFGGIDHNRRRNQGDMDYVTNYLTDQSQLIKSGIQTAERINTGFRTGFDYQPSPANSFSATGNGGSLTINNNGDWELANTSPSQNVPDQSKETDDNHKTGHYGGADVKYEHKFDSLRKSVSISALWNTVSYDDNFLNLITDMNGSEQMKQTTDLNKLRNTYQFNADYASPAGKSGNLSFGYQILWNHENETYQSIISHPAPPVETRQETEFIEIIQAGYGTWQYKMKKLDLTAGLRAENLDRSLTTLTNQYPAQHFNLYPSLNSSFNIDSIQKIRFNYSRRTDQLKSNMLDPLPRWYDLYNVIVGNPNLKNEIINKITLGYLVNFKKLTLDDELFYTSTNDNVELIRSIYKDGIIQNRYENTGTYKSFGNEFNADWNTFSWLNFNQKIAFISTRLDGMLDGVSLQKKFHQWYFATTADFVLSPSTTLQLDFSYYGPNTSAQSSIDHYWVAGLSFRQTFFDKKFTFTMTGRDFLGLYRTVEHIQGDGFNQDITTETIFPIRFSLSYKFNRYKRDERRTAKTPVAD